MGEEEEAPLTIDNFLHRGTTLRNTEYVYGLVMYTGHQTKFMLNISSPRHKTSKLEVFTFLFYFHQPIFPFYSFYSFSHFSPLADHP